MTLPLIIAPTGAPEFLADGHSIDEDSVFSQIDFTTGHSRARQVWTVTDRVVTVRWFLEASVMAAVDEWFESDLRAGELEFAARVRAQGQGMLWWTARWISFETEMLHYGRGRLSGRLLLTGEGSVEGPVTGILAMEVGVPLRSIPSTIATPKVLAMEVEVTLSSVN